MISCDLCQFLYFASDFIASQLVRVMDFLISWPSSTRKGEDIMKGAGVFFAHLRNEEGMYCWDPDQQLIRMN